MMRESNDSVMKRIQVMLLTGLLLVIFSGTAMAQKAILHKISIQDNPLSVQLDISKKVPVKVVRIENKEVLIALKDVTLSQNFTVKGRQLPGVKEVNVDSLQGDVVAVVIITRSAYGSVQSAFSTSGLQFIVSMAPLKSPGEKKYKQKALSETENEKAGAAVEDKSDGEKGARTTLDTVPVTPEVSKKPASKSPETVKISTPPVYVPPQREKSRFQGDISDLCQIIASRECRDPQFDNAIRLIKNKSYKDGYDLLEQYILRSDGFCLEQAYYLKAYAYYKSLAKDDFALLIKAERLFQDALVLYPISDYVPFAYTAIGLIHTDLNNMPAAEGYFNIVMQEYKTYPGMPEVLYHLARVFDEKGYIDNALGYYQRVFESPSDNSYILDAGIGYGKALFDKQQYYTALSVFNHVIKMDEQKVYTSPSLLLYMADANFALSLSKAARENYMRVMNLFPEIPDRDMLLSKVGDTYAMENNEQKAIKMYELVREKFPDSQGYIAASMGLARYLATDQEKIEIYEMIKTRFPENTLSRIAMMRLAEIYQKNGEYDKCITEIEMLLSTHPRGLRYEAVKLMQKAYEALFEQQLKKNDFTSVLNRYESEYGKIDRMDSREIAFSVGTAYVKATLFEEAFNHLLNAYKKYKRSERSPELLFFLGVAMDESGRDEDAVKLLEAFSNQYKNHENRVEALMRAGNLYLEKNEYAKAVSRFNDAYAASRNNLVKGHILLRHAAVFEQQNDLKTAVELQAAAVKDFAGAPGKNYDTLTQAYKILGNTYIGLNAYVQAADAFSKALDFSEGERLKANLGFLLGDAYQKGNVLEKARDAFEQVADTYDSVWSRLARQRLATLDLAQTVTNS